MPKLSALKSEQPAHTRLTLGRDPTIGEQPPGVAVEQQSTFTPTRPAAVPAATLALTIQQPGLATHSPQAPARSIHEIAVTLAAHGEVVAAVWGSSVGVLYGLQSISILPATAISAIMFSAAVVTLIAVVAMTLGQSLCALGRRSQQAALLEELKNEATTPLRFQLIIAANPQLVRAHAGEIFHAIAQRTQAARIFRNAHGVENIREQSWRLLLRHPGILSPILSGTAPACEIPLTPMILGDATEAEFNALVRQSPLRFLSTERTWSDSRLDPGILSAIIVAYPQNVTERCAKAILTTARLALRLTDDAFDIVARHTPELSHNAWLELIVNRHVKIDTLLYLGEKIDGLFPDGASMRETARDIGSAIGIDPEALMELVVQG